MLFFIDMGFVIAGLLTALVSVAVRRRLPVDAGIPLWAIYMLFVSLIEILLILTGHSSDMRSYISALFLLGSTAVFNMLLAASRRTGACKAYRNSLLALSVYTAFIMTLKTTTLLWHINISTTEGIDGPSMYPTFRDGQQVTGYIVKDEDRAKLKVGDIAVFKTEGGFDAWYDRPRLDILYASRLPYHLAQGEKLIIKRIVAKGGNRVSYGEDGSLYIDGVLKGKDKPFSFSKQGAVLCSKQKKDGVMFLNCDIPEGYFFVLGDNRSDSLDSRILGLLPASSVVAKVRDDGK